MILQALAKYYERMPTAAQEGFQQQAIPFVITLNRQGNFVGLMDTREGDGKKKGRVLFSSQSSEKIRQHSGKSFYGVHLPMF